MILPRKVWVSKLRDELTRSRRGSWFRVVRLHSDGLGMEKSLPREFSASSIFMSELEGGLGSLSWRSEEQLE
jgi:hypothetical protein